MLDGLFTRALITPDGSRWCVAAEGYDALGMPRPGINQKCINRYEAKLDQIIANAEGAPSAPQGAPEDAGEALSSHDQPDATLGGTAPAKPRTRDNSKQAEVIRMLQRPEGATIGQIVLATGWQAHTVRGTFAGAFKKKLGLTLTSDKTQGGERVYRIA